jgi:hypothetical protein
MKEKRAVVSVMLFPIVPILPLKFTQSIHTGHYNLFEDVVQKKKELY